MTASITGFQRDHPGCTHGVLSMLFDAQVIERRVTLDALTERLDALEDIPPRELLLLAAIRFWRSQGLSPTQMIGKTVVL